MSQTKLTITNFRITDLQLGLHFKNIEKVQVHVKIRSNAFTPINPEDPTILVKSKIEYLSDQTDEVQIKCSTEHIFTLDPVPENRLEDIADPCNKMITENIGHKIESIISAMGYDFSILEGN